jgi:hypothetical protein
MQLEKPSYEFDKINFNCDCELGSHIRAPFPNQSFFWVLVGKPGSGKSSMMLNAMTSTGKNRVYKGVFNKVLLCMPSNSRDSIKNNPFADLDASNSFETFDEKILERVKEIRESFDEMAENDKKKGKKPKQRNMVLIIDDVTSYLKDSPHILTELTTNRRHLKLSIILLVQFLRAIPKPVRFFITNISMFKPSNDLDTKILQEEYINLKKEDFQELKRLVWVNSHDVLTIDKNNDNYYKNYQRIKIKSQYIDASQEENNESEKDSK